MSSQSFELSLLDLSPANLEEAAAFYAETGYLALRDTEAKLTPKLEEVLGGIMEELELDLGALLDGSMPLYAFTEEQRKTLSQIGSSPDLQAWLVAALEPLLLRLLGPVVHVSRDFHAQFKGGDMKAPAVDHGGYPGGTTYLEPFGQYLLHQDFTGASLPTSPGFLTVWVPLTTGPNWGLRLYPGSHRRGIMCNEWIQLDDERLEMLGKPVDFPAERGRALVFHGLLLHSTANPGEARRVSCDVRFFPLCGFLPSTPWLLDTDPATELEPPAGDDEILRASRLEAQVYLGRPPAIDGLPEHSVLNWVRYVERIVAGDRDGALEHLERFTNPALTGETSEVYRKKYHHQPLCEEMIERTRAAFGEPASASHPRLAF